MCNDYKVQASLDDIASDFGASFQVRLNFPTEIFPGYSGPVIREVDGQRQIQTMAWGFPRHAVSKKTGKPLKPTKVNNARDDRLLDPFWPWKESFEQRRCLIPLTAWAEAEGEPGRMTKTWYSLPGKHLFAVGGIWRPTDEWGDAYSMVMVDGCAQMSDVHDRMPVLLTPDEYDPWMRAPAEEALAMVRTCHNELAVDRSTELWFKPKRAETEGTLL